MVLLGALALLVLFWAGPGVKAMLEQSRQAQSRDWAGLLVPLLLVIAFVILLIKLV
jgi:flagellar biogenesis protein FliO